MPSRGIEFHSTDSKYEISAVDAGCISYMSVALDIHSAAETEEVSRPSVRELHIASTASLVPIHSDAVIKGALDFAIRSLISVIEVSHAGGGLLVMWPINIQSSTTLTAVLIENKSGSRMRSKLGLSHSTVIPESFSVLNAVRVYRCPTSRAVHIILAVKLEAVLHLRKVSNLGYREQKPGL
jgi:hypothetical protein